MPGGSEASEPIIQRFCAVVGWGSAQYLTAQQSLLRVAGIFGVLAVVVWFLVGRTDWAPVPAVPAVRRRRLGQIITSSGLFYWRHRSLMARIVAIYVPVLAGSGLVVSGVARLLSGAIPDGADPNLGPIGAAVVGVAGAAVQGIGLLTINAAVIDVVDRIEHDREVSARAGYRAALDAWRPLLGAAVRGVLIVVGLAVTIVGIPWAIRQYVRYQLATSAIITEDIGNGKEALARSSEPVGDRYRWFHTATVIVMVQGSVALMGLVAGLIFLLATNGLPLG